MKMTPFGPNFFGYSRSYLFSMKTTAQSPVFLVFQSLLLFDYHFFIFVILSVSSFTTLAQQNVLENIKTVNCRVATFLKNSTKHFFQVQDNKLSFQVLWLKLLGLTLCDPQLSKLENALKWMLKRGWNVSNFSYLMFQYSKRTFK